TACDSFRCRYCRWTGDSPDWYRRWIYIGSRSYCFPAKAARSHHYRPESVPPRTGSKIKGMLRNANDTSLSIPAPSEVTWEVTEGDEKRCVKEGTAPLSPFGAWEASWEVPEKVRTGRYQIRCKIENDAYAGMAEVDIE